MRIARVFAVAVAAVSVCLAGSIVHAGTFAKGTSPSVANAVTVVYDPADGNLMVNGGGNADPVKITTLEIKSKSSKFSPSAINAGLFTGLFDVKSAAKLFTLKPGDGFAEMNIGKVLPAGMSIEQLIAELDVNGSILPSGGLAARGAGGPYLYAVPEPSSMVLVALGMLGLLGVRRK